MYSLIAYSSPQDYLDASENWLMERETDNNLALGLCYAFSDKTQPVKDAHFINVFYNGQIIVTAVKTWHKLIVTGYTETREALEPLAAYLVTQRVQLTGLFGTVFHTHALAEILGRPVTEHIGILVHELQQVNTAPFPEGSFQPATASDLELLLDWTLCFENDIGMKPPKKREEIQPLVERRALSGDYFKWVRNGETVSIAAVVRKTKNTGIIGIVYTPPALRGKGYASGCVQALSTHLLQQGFSRCGLFTDADNPVSNAIYYKIGYVPGTRFADLSFV
jgi:uncharacterized protein